MKLAASLCFLLFVSNALAADTTRFVVVNSGVQKGIHKRWSDSPGHQGYFFEYNDRGRGPRLTVDIRLDHDGIIVERTVSGYDYFKAPVNEQFSIKDGKASWTSGIETGGKPVNNKVLYSPLNGVPAEIELQVKALLKAHGHQLELLPAGMLKATHIKNHSTKLDGLIIELELYSIGGAGGPPTLIWFTPKKDFFASLGWFTVIAEGHEDLIPELRNLQDEIEEDFYAGQAAELTKKADAILIKNVAVFDALKGTVAKGKTVLIENGRISKVGKAKKVKGPASATVVDGTGKTLLPGLWDNHTHYDISSGVFHVAAGVTNVRDMGSTGELPSLKKKIDDEIVLGPEISVMCGFLDLAGPFAGPGKKVTTLDEGLEAVNEYAKSGYQQLKLYSSIPADWVKPLAARAHEKGMKVSGHVPSFMTAERAVRDGYDEINHVNMLMLNFLGDSLDTRSMGRFVKVGERAGGIDLNSSGVKSFVALLKERNTAVDPTMNVFEEMFVYRPGQLAKGYETVAADFPADYKRMLYTWGLPTAKGRESVYKGSFDNMLKMVSLLHASGIRILPGTDAPLPGFALHRELELYSAAGISNADILRGATIMSAKAAGVDRDYGTIEVGKKAHLALISGDPLKNISDVRKVELTIKGRNLYESKALYASYGFGQAK